jgi:peptidoglycan/xylan/chitin deacetylase (PgdA/CDA1 family)
MNTLKNEWRDTHSEFCWNMKNKNEAYEAFLTATRYASTWSFRKKEEYTCFLEEELNVSFDNDFGSCLMSWDQVLNIANDGHAIGGHTISHPNLTKIPIYVADEEILYCKKLIQEKTGIEIEHFAYPNPILCPNWNDDIVLLLKKYHYKTSVTSDRGNVTKNSNLHSLRRISPSADIVEFLWSLNNPLNNVKNVI